MSSQLLEQPPRPDVDTPLKGRKALIFSDGRQAASRLAGKLQQYSMRDAVRPLVLDGLEKLELRFGAVALEHAYAALLTGCVISGVTLRPAQATHFEEDLQLFRELLSSSPPLTEKAFLSRSAELNTHRTNKALMLALYPVLKDPHTGLSALGLGSIQALIDETDLAALHKLPAPPMPAELTQDDWRLALLDLWLNDAVLSHAVFLPTTPSDWLDSPTGAKISRTRASFPGFVKDLVGTKWFNAHLKGSVASPTPWGSFLRKTFGASETANGFILRAAKLRVITTGIEWRRCDTCTTAQPFNPLAGARCRMRLGRRECGGTTRPLDPLRRFGLPLKEGTLSPAYRAPRVRAWLCAPPLRRRRALRGAQRQQQQRRRGQDRVARAPLSRPRRRRARRPQGRPHRCPLMHDHDGGRHRHRQPHRRRAEERSSRAGELSAARWARWAPWLCAVDGRHLLRRGQPRPGVLRESCCDGQRSSPRSQRSTSTTSRLSAATASRS